MIDAARGTTMDWNYRRTHVIDIVGQGNAASLTDQVKGEIQIDVADPVVNARIQSIYREADLRVFALLETEKPPKPVGPENRLIKEGERPRR